jgi:hypothetical protein
MKQRKARDIAHVRTKAAEAEAARRALHATAAARDRNRPETYDAWHDAVVAFRAAIAAAYPAGFWDSMGRRYERLAHGEPDAIEMAVFFLESDPWFDRSGYVKEALLKRLKRLPLTPRIAARLHRVLLAAVDGRDRREFRRYCWLARSLVTPDLTRALRERLTSADAGVRRRAEWMLAAVERRPVRSEVMAAHAAWYRPAWEAAAAGVDFQQPGWWDRLHRPLPQQPRHCRAFFGMVAEGGWRMRHRRSSHGPIAAEHSGAGEAERMREE